MTGLLLNEGLNMKIDNKSKAQQSLLVDGPSQALIELEENRDQRLDKTKLENDIDHDDQLDDDDEDGDGEGAEDEEDVEEENIPGAKQILNKSGALNFSTIVIPRGDQKKVMNTNDFRSAINLNNLSNNNNYYHHLHDYLNLQSHYHQKKSFQQPLVRQHPAYSIHNTKPKQPVMNSSKSIAVSLSVNQPINVDSSGSSMMNEYRKVNKVVDSTTNNRNKNFKPVVTVSSSGTSTQSKCLIM